MAPLPLGPAEASRLAACALAAVRQRFPHKLDHLILDERDLALPSAIHPVFDGSYDWHSSVHMHWSLLRLLRRQPALPQREDIVAHFDERFVASLLAAERAYAAHPRRRGFERPYGWAWLLALQAELDTPDSALPRRAAWAEALRPFSVEVAARLAHYLERSHYAVRAGTHANSAFAMLLARRFGEPGLNATIERSARRWFGDDRSYPADYEPGGADFLSPGLLEALLMRMLLGEGFAAWWTAFVPRADALERWMRPARVSDRIDAQGVHLDGLNLSRAWCLEALSTALDAPLAARCREAAQAHRAAAWPHVTGGDFAATHWLVSFALLSLGD
ncbi:DUF2891 domain-containing protein [uncultured Piscinibacter sp.]|uniref:DUF2891 domain-containing protein n=1 Tax=uncultured Piscinibacter sp. TaxID=1131835 RepID=UPI002611C1D1|nr:DUF2891 domain-containing protein [uncultured Piscinibacter sp.]